MKKSSTEKFKKLFTVLSLFFTFSLSIALSLSASGDTFKTLIGTIKEPGLLLPDSTFQQYTDYGPLDKTTGAVRIGKSHDELTVDRTSGLITERSTGNTETSVKVFDSNLRIKEGTVVLTDAAVIVKEKYDTLSYVFDKNGNQLVSTYSLRGTTTNVKKVEYPWGTIDSGLVAISARVLLLAGFRKDFTAEIVDRDSSMIASMQFYYGKTGDLATLLAALTLSPEMKRELKSLMASDELFNVYTMEVFGLLKAFYPHKIFLVYREKYPYTQVLSVSNPASNPIFSVGTF